MRFFAAISVILFHYTFRGPHGNDYLTKLKFEQIDFLTRYGYLGVELFFMISGFVIMLSAQNSNITNFLLSRIKRLFPAYLFCVTITAIVLIVSESNIVKFDLVDYLLNLTMLNGLFGIISIDGSYWSLLIELKFYFLVSVLLFLKLNKLEDFQNFVVIWLMITVLNVIVGNTAMREFMILKIVNFIFLTDYSAFFIAGILFYLIRENGFNLKRSILLSVTLLLSLDNSIKTMQKLEKFYVTQFDSNIVLFVICMFFLSFVFFGLKNIIIVQYSVIRFLGTLTYPLYLIHQNVGYIIINKLELLMNRYFILTVLLISMMVFSFCINKFIEDPLSKFFESRILKFRRND